MLKAYFLVLFLICFNTVFGKSSVVEAFWYQHQIYDSKENTVLPSQIMVFRDDSNSLSYESVKDYGSNYYIRLSEIDRFESTKTYWVKVIFKNSSGVPQDLVVFTGNNAFSTIYIHKEDKVDSLKTGYFVPYHQRSIKKGFESKFPLKLESNQTASILIKIKSLDNYPPRFDLRTVPNSLWQKNTTTKNFLVGTFTGLSLILSIVGFTFFYFVKRNEFLFYGIYALISSVYFLYYHGFLDEYISPTDPKLVSFMWLLPNLSAIFYFSFARLFLNTSITQPKWDKFFKTFIGVITILFIANSIYVTLTLDIFNSLIVLNYINIGLCITVILFIVSLKNFTSTEVRYFTVASIFLVTTVLFASVEYLIDLDIQLIPFVQIAVSIELLLFSFGMGHKMKKLIENHAITQESLILQLVENERIQEKTNSELKEKVAERTHQINVQNVELKRARLEAEKATKSKSDFLSVMSHEIRTPLNAIISLSHLMDIDNENEETQEYIDALKFSSESLNSLINDILDYNKIEAGKLRLEKVEFSLIDLLKNIRDSFKFKATSKGIQLIINLSENTPNRIIGDPTRLTQIFNNLISNALKFTDEGSVEVFAELKGIEDEKVTLEFFVKDTGIGISVDKITAIFEDFEQASSDTTRKYGGTGLGLAITRKLIEMHDSEIHVASEVDKGTTFSFSLDFELPESFDLLSANKIDTVFDLKKANILVVDDNYMNRLVLRRLFAKWNANFHEAENGNQACQKVNESEFDLILMDVHMDGMNGFECTEFIKTRSLLNKNTKVIGMTALRKNDVDDAIKSSYLNEFINKPFDPKELLKKLVFYLSNEYEQKN
jgi:signal transduction histidine kinase/CheY-like chemotaxis protein